MQEWFRKNWLALLVTVVIGVGGWSADSYGTGVLKAVGPYAKWGGAAALLVFLGWSVSWRQLSRERQRREDAETERREQRQRAEYAEKRANAEARLRQEVEAKATIVPEAGAELVDCSETDGCENVDYVLWSRTEDDKGDKREHSLGVFDASFGEVAIEVLVPSCAGRHRYWPTVRARLHLHTVPRETTGAPYVSLGVAYLSLHDRRLIGEWVPDLYSKGHAIEGNSCAPMVENAWHRLRIARDQGRGAWDLWMDDDCLHTVSVHSGTRSVEITVDMQYGVPDIMKTGEDCRSIRDGMIAQAWFRNFRVR